MFWVIWSEAASGKGTTLDQSWEALSWGKRSETLYTQIWREVLLIIMAAQSNMDWVFWILSNNSHLSEPTCSQATQLTGQLTDQSFICLQGRQPQGSLLKDESADSDKNMTKTNIQNWDLILCCSYLVFLSQQTIHHIIHFVILYILTCQHVFLLVELEFSINIFCYAWSGPAGTRPVPCHDPALAEAINKVKRSNLLWQIFVSSSFPYNDFLETGWKWTWLCLCPSAPDGPSQSSLIMVLAHYSDW